MKTIFIFILVCFASFQASSQEIKTRAIVSVPLNNSANDLNTNFTQRFLDNGNKFLNVNGSTPKHVVGHMAVNSDRLKKFTKPDEQLIGNTLLFTGDLPDYISKPYLHTPKHSKKGTSRN